MNQRATERRGESVEGESLRGRAEADRAGGGLRVFGWTQRYLVTCLWKRSVIISDVVPDPPGHEPPSTVLFRHRVISPEKTVTEKSKN